MVGFYDGCSTLLSTETIRRPCAKLHHRPEFKFVPRNPNSEFRPPPARELLDEARVEAAAAATRAVVAAALVAVLVGRVAARDPSLVVQRGDERDYARGKRGPSAVHSKRSSSLCTHHRPNSSAGPSTAGSRRTKRAVKKHYRQSGRASELLARCHQMRRTETADRWHFFRDSTVLEWTVRVPSGEERRNSERRGANASHR